MNKYEHIIVPESIKGLLNILPEVVVVAVSLYLCAIDKSMQNIYKGNLMLPEQMTQMLSSK